MIKNLIGYAIGSSVAKSAPVAGGTTGAMIASAVPFVISRMSIPTMIAFGVGGYLIKRYLDNSQDEKVSTDAPSPAATNNVRAIRNGGSARKKTGSPKVADA